MDVLILVVALSIVALEALLIVFVVGVLRIMGFGEAVKVRWREEEGEAQGEPGEAVWEQALGYDPTDPTDAILPREDLEADFVWTPQGQGVDLTGDVGQIDVEGGVDEPTVLPDGTVVFRGEIVREGNG